MRQYMIAFCILLIFPVFRFTIAAPVALGETLAVRSNAVDDLKDGIVVWEKRVDSNDRWSTNEVHRKPEDDNPGDDSDLDDAPGGYSEEDMLGSESSWRYQDQIESDRDSAQVDLNWDSEQMESDARGPDPHYNDPLADDYNESDSAKSDSSSNDGGNGNESDNSSGDSGNDSSDSSGDSGYHGDNDSDSDNSMQGSESQGSAASPETTSLGPESEHFATPKDMLTDFGKVLEGFRPRNSGSGAVGMPKRESQGTVDTKAARATSASKRRSRWCSHVRT